MPKNNQKQLTQRLVISAIFIAISIVLNELLAIRLPWSGSVTFFSMVPLALLGWQYGLGWGMVCGTVMGTLDLLIGGLANFSYVNGITAYLILILADYLVAYGVMGVSGVFKKVIKNSYVAFGLGAALACALRFVCHFISGVTIWADYADGFANVWLYSLTYNGGYMLPELIITVIGCVAILKPAQKLFKIN
ncbi:MAG: energy-coupled thiamine transporter ThiT [Clostridia bacterium]|nr:energy-coupled thiamine transporter ThiT [Clostridia bacterium]